MKNTRNAPLSLFLLSAILFDATPHLLAQTPASPPDFSVYGVVSKELHLSIADLKKMPHTSLTAKDHSGTSHTYEGVPLQALLADAGVPHGGDLRGKNMTLVVVAEASDGYRAAFSLAELDGDFTGTEVLVVDAADGKPLTEKEGSLRLVVPADKRPARWVRMLKGIKVASAE